MRPSTFVACENSLTININNLKKLLHALTAVILFLMPSEIFGQAPALGTTASFVLFTGVGAITNGASPIYLTHLTGNLGSNSGAATGFGNVDGVLYSGDATTATATSDLAILNTRLDTTTPTFHPSSSTIGGGDTLIAGVYAYTGAATLNGNLFLNAQGNPNAVFIFQFPGTNTFDPAANSKVILVNGAKACNVFWKVGGAVGSIAAGTNVNIRGTIVSNGAINLYSGDTLEGRALSTIGAISVQGTGGIVAFTPIGCGSPVLTGPTAPTLGATKSYALLSTSGAVTNAGLSHILGDIGGITAAPTGFGTAVVNGTIHFADSSAIAASASLGTLYAYLNTLSYDIELLRPDMFGHDLVLTPHTYLLNAATDLSDTVILDAQGDANAVFVFQISGAFNALTSSFVKLINGTKAKNVFWKVTGASTVFTNSIFNGSIIGGGGASAILLNTGVIFNGRAMTVLGAITINAATINADVLPVAGPITGDSLVCVGASIPLAGVDTGGVWSRSNLHATVSTRGIVTGVTAGIDTVRYVVTNPFGADTSFKIVTVNPLPVAGPITGPSSVCLGLFITLLGADSVGIWSRSNSNATISSGGVVTGVAAGLDTMKYTVTNTCGSDTATKVITIIPLPNAGTITGASSVCTGATITLADVVAGGSWSATNTHATVVLGVITGVSIGTDTIRYVIANACGVDTAIKAVIVNPAPNAGVIAGFSSVCTGSVITLTNAVTGGVWSASNTHATVVGGVTSGVSSGIDTVIYSFTNSCGTVAATKVITINPTPSAGSITGASSVCVASSTTFTDGISGGTWSAGNATAAITAGGIVTGISAGIDTIIYTVTNGCGTVATIRPITINPSPDAGVITGLSSACVGLTFSLTAGVTGGVWSCSNAVASITTAGVITAVLPGIDTIIYTVTNGCGTAATTKPLKINALPLLISTLTPAAICDGSVFSYTAVTDTATASLNWTRAVVSGISNTANSGIGNISEALNNTTNNAVVVTYIYIASANGCSSSQSVLVTVNPTAKLAGILLDTVCSATPINYIVSSLTPGAVITWSRANIASILPGASSGTGDIHETLTNSLLVPVNVIYAFTLTANGCVASQNFRVQVNPVPAVPVITTKSPNSVCANTLFQNFGATTPATGIVYHWSVVNAIIWATSPNGQNALISFPNPGIAQVALSSNIISFPCKSMSSFSVNIKSSIAQIADVRYFEDHFVCTPSDKDAYQWGYDDVATLDSTMLPGEINQDYLNVNPDFAHKYYWVNTSNGDCMQKTYCNAPLVLQNINSATTMDIFPNPSSDLIKVVVNTNIVEDIQIEIVNMAGQQLVATATINNKAVIDVSNLAVGMYVVNCYNNGFKVAYSRFIKN